jgi:hypothetical protein
MFSYIISLPVLTWIHAESVTGSAPSIRCEGRIFLASIRWSSFQCLMITSSKNFKMMDNAQNNSHNNEYMNKVKSTTVDWGSSKLESVVVGLLSLELWCHAVHFVLPVYHRNISVLLASSGCHIFQTHSSELAVTTRYTTQDIVI